MTPSWLRAFAGHLLTRVGLVLGLALSHPAQAQLTHTPAAPAFNTRFVTVAFHDVGERMSLIPAEQRDDAITTERLVAFLDWLRGNGWTAIRLADIEAAHQGLRPLPDQAILLTVDDGYLSLFTHIYPLALAYRMPFVAALNTGWLAEKSPEATVSYGQVKVPRSRFITWAQAREMNASGMVEFASHGHDLHRGEPMTPQGSTAASAVTRIWQAGRGHETDAQQRARLRQDFQRTRDAMTRELGQAPKALAWPFGAHTALSREMALASGFSVLFTLDPEPSNARRTDAIARFLPTADPRLGELIDAMTFSDPLSSATRMVCLDPARLLPEPPAPGAPALSDAQREATLERRLGEAIERVRALGATHVLIEAASASGHTWFPNEEGVPHTDVLPRIARQLTTRGGVAVVVRLGESLALSLAGQDRARAIALYRSLGHFVRPAGLWVGDGTEHGPQWPGRPPAVRDARHPWLVRGERDLIDAPSLPPQEAFSHDAWRAVRAANDVLAVHWWAPAQQAQPGGLADMTWVSASRDTAPGRALRAERWVPPAPPGGRSDSRRMGLWLEGDTPPSDATLVASFRQMARQGGTALGWCPDGLHEDPPSPARVFPHLGARTQLPE